MDFGAYEPVWTGKVLVYENVEGGVNDLLKTVGPFVVILPYNQIFKIVNSSFYIQDKYNLNHIGSVVNVSHLCGKLFNKNGDTFIKVTHKLFLLIRPVFQHKRYSVIMY